MKIIDAIGFIITEGELIEIPLLLFAERLKSIFKIRPKIRVKIAQLNVAYR